MREVRKQQANSYKLGYNVYAGKEEGSVKMSRIFRALDHQECRRTLRRSKAIEIESMCSRFADIMEYLKSRSLVQNQVTKL